MSNANLQDKHSIEKFFIRTNYFQLPSQTYQGSTGASGDSSTIQFSGSIGISDQEIKNSDYIAKKLFSFVFTCRDHTVTITGCQTPYTDTPYTYIANFEQPAHRSQSYTFSTFFMNSHVCPTISAGSPTLLTDTGTVTAPTQEEIRNLAVQSNGQYIAIPADKFIPSMLTLKPTRIKYEDPEDKKLKELDCTNKGIAANLYWDVHQMDTVVCKNNVQEPPVTIATCGADGMMHVSPIITQRFPSSITSFKLGEPYICYAPDPLLAQYEKHKKSQNNIIDREMYQIIKGIQTHVAACKRRDAISHVPDCSVLLFFNHQELVNMLPLNPPAQLRKAIKEISNTELFYRRKLEGDFLDSNALQKFNLTHCNSDKKSYTNSAAIAASSSAVGILIAAVAIIAACLKCGPVRIRNAGRSQLNKCRKNVCTEEADVEMSATNSRTPTETKKNKDIEQNAPLTQTSHASSSKQTKKEAIEVA